MYIEVPLLLLENTLNSCRRDKHTSHYLAKFNNVADTMLTGTYRFVRFKSISSHSQDKKMMIVSESVNGWAIMATNNIIVEVSMSVRH